MCSLFSLWASYSFFFILSFLLTIPLHACLSLFSAFWKVESQNSFCCCCFIWKRKNSCCSWGKRKISFIFLVSFVAPRNDKLFVSGKHLCTSGDNSYRTVPISRCHVFTVNWQNSKWRKKVQIEIILELRVIFCDTAKKRRRRKKTFWRHNAF